ncbi:MAG: hypothetical protein ACI9ZT_000514, partial [Gammaproteobacteria bacterium]
MNRIVVWFPLPAIVLSILAARYPECLIGFKSAIIPVSLGLAVNHYYGRTLAGIKIGIRHYFYHHHYCCADFTT